MCKNKTSQFVQKQDIAIYFDSDEYFNYEICNTV
uniref:Uncharacterized protein n=1 Tax=Arundo donax TaxID=35708 RepID=A0A0A9HMC1_ARUDO